MSREVALFTDWYAPALDIQVDEDSYFEAWRKSWGDILKIVENNPVLVLRDYHADNLMVLPDRERLGLLDFQDALAGHPAYDLVSLLQDARRDVAPALEEAMIARYVEAANVADAELFRAHYEILGAQRNTKILGIFTRLWRRDGKTHYLPLQPRVWAYLERNLAHPALAPVRAWFDANVPAGEARGRLAAGSGFQAGAGGVSRYRKPLALRPNPGAAVPEAAMVMAAGLGKRMRPLTATRPEAADRGRRQAADRPCARAAPRRRRAQGDRQRPLSRRRRRSASRGAQGRPGDR